MQATEVLGGRLAKCVETAKLIQRVADDREIPVHVAKESSPDVIVAFSASVQSSMIHRLG